MIGSTQLLYLSSKMPARSLNCFAIILQLLSCLSQQPGWRRGMSLASQMQGPGFDPYPRHTCQKSFFFFLALTLVLMPAPVLRISQVEDEFPDANIFSDPIQDIFLYLSSKMPSRSLNCFAIIL